MKRAECVDGVHTTLHTAVYDMNGREAEEAEPILKALPNLQQYIFCSSAGVYLKSDEMPHREEDAVDPKSRHKVFFVVIKTLLSSVHVDEGVDTSIMYTGQARH